MNRYIIPLIIVFIAAGIAIFYVDGGYSVVRQRIQREEELAKFISDANDVRNKLDNISSEYNSFPENADKRLNVLLPDVVDPVAYTVDINHIAELHGLRIAAVVVTDEQLSEESTETEARHRIQFQVTSTYSVFRAFMRDLESSLALRDFRALSFRAGAAPEGEDVAVQRDPSIDLAVMQYDVELVTYSLR